LKRVLLLPPFFPSSPNSIHSITFETEQRALLDRRYFFFPPFFFQKNCRTSLHRVGPPLSPPPPLFFSSSSPPFPVIVRRQDHGRSLHFLSSSSPFLKLQNIRGRFLINGFFLAGSSFFFFFRASVTWGRWMNG